MTQPNTPRAPVEPLTDAELSELRHELAVDAGPWPDVLTDMRRLLAALDAARAERDRDAVAGERWAAVRNAPLLSDLRDAICFIERHEHLATTSYCDAGRAQAHRIREALIARYQYRAAATPTEQPRDDGGLPSVESVAIAMGRVRAAHNGPDGVEGGPPCDWCQLAAEHALQAVRAALTDGAPDS